MPKLTVAEKCTAALLEGRIAVLEATPEGLTLECESRGTGARYVSRYGHDQAGVLRTCTCASGRAHPWRPRCWHALAAELLSPKSEGSSR